jgi:holo-[acyl-carrier protein] synthase
MCEKLLVGWEKRSVGMLAERLWKSNHRPYPVAAMPIVGHGIDIVETARIRRMVDQHAEHFLNRVYTPAEQAYAARNPKRYIEHLAGRFAAKEAVLKVLGTGWRGGIAWTDIEIRSEPSGQPTIHLTGECERIARDQGIDRWHISISHIETHATASAIGWRDQTNA